MKKKDSENQIQYMPIGMCLGLSIGMAIGTVMNNVGVGMCLGMGIGVDINNFEPVNFDELKRNNEHFKECYHVC